ncbi:MAG: ATP synthase F1 subunit delta [Lachnospiraceae bacterium]|nr:ATP synthase F1 subunit delta [Lachnospiraceae bacterium]
MAKLVSKTYGEALFEIAVEGNKTAELMEEVQGIVKILDANPEFDNLMKHPGVSKQEKLQIIREVFRGKTSGELSGFLEVVVSKERYNELRSILKYFIDRVKEADKIGVAYVTTPMALSDVQKKSVEARILATSEYKTMEMCYKVDASLIGGMIIRIGDRVVDSSIRTKLDELTKQLLQIQLG